jgi:hypothetical protein
MVKVIKSAFLMRFGRKKRNFLIKITFFRIRSENALDSMVKNRAPCTDGIPLEFYQSCWGIVKNDIMNLF